MSKVFRFERKRRIYESLPIAVKQLVHLVPFSWIAGSPYRGVMARNSFFKNATREECLKYQETQLKEMLLHATSQVEAYRKHRSIVERLSALEAIKDFQPVDKQDIQANFEKYLPKNIASLPHYDVATGGTSGNQFHFILDNNSQSIELAYIHRLWQVFGYSPKFKKASFRGVSTLSAEEEKYWNLNPIYNELQFSPFHMNKNSLPKYIDRLTEYRPLFIHGYNVKTVFWNIKVFSKTSF